MSDAVNLGPVNGHAVGRILKEAVRRAGAVIRAERLTFEQHAKAGYGGAMDDVFTSADIAAQEVYLRTFRECFPGAGVLGEEDALSLAAVAPITAWFTVDPIDGTKAFVRRQSHGITTMVALVDLDASGNAEVISAYVGDVNSDEVYGYRPGSSKVHRITRLDTFETLQVLPEGLPPLSRVHALLRDPAEEYSEPSQKIIAAFETHEVMGSSIGGWAARLWKGEVHALLFPASFDTPWDMTPVIGISKKIGFAFLRPEGGVWRAFDWEIPRKVQPREHDVLVIHASYLKDGALRV